MASTKLEGFRRGLEFELLVQIRSSLEFNVARVVGGFLHGSDQRNASTQCMQLTHYKTRSHRCGRRSVPFGLFKDPLEALLHLSHITFVVLHHRLTLTRHVLQVQFICVFFFQIPVCQ